MLVNGTDEASLRLPDGKTKKAAAIQVLSRRGEVGATLGCLPSLEKWAAWLPDKFFSQGLKAVEDMAGIAVGRVNARLESAAKEGYGGDYKDKKGIWNDGAVVATVRRQG